MSDEKLWIKSNGSRLVVRKVSEPLMEFRSEVLQAPLPIKDEIMDADRAREYVKWVMGNGLYTRTK